MYRLGVGSFAGAAIGFGTIFIARFLAASGDTLEMLEAVLDTNFWLATHVTCVTLGYVATGVAGLIAIIYIVGGVFTPAMKSAIGRQVSGMLYGTICFAMLLSFVGTVLGGIWADQSWGRFWGWDPKENGAVLIVIWNALILHARWAGLARARGVAVLAVVGMMWTAWSWFGTNQLGIGLHAYGFDNRLANGCAVWWLAMSLIVALGLVPLKYWASFCADDQVGAASRAAPVARLVPLGSRDLPIASHALRIPQRESRYRPEEPVCLSGNVDRASTITFSNSNPPTCTIFATRTPRAKTTSPRACIRASNAIARKSCYSGRTSSPSRGWEMSAICEGFFRLMRSS